MPKLCRWHLQMHFINTLKLRQHGDIFKCIFLTENVWIPIGISLKFVPKIPINNIPALVQMMTCWLVRIKPLSESLMVRSPTHLCIAKPQWVKFQSAAYYVWVNNHNSCSATIDVCVSYFIASPASQWLMLSWWTSTFYSYPWNPAPDKPEASHTSRKRYQMPPIKTRTTPDSLDRSSCKLKENITQCSEFSVSSGHLSVTIDTL